MGEAQRYIPHRHGDSGPAIKFHDVWLLAQRDIDRQKATQAQRREWYRACSFFDQALSYVAAHGLAVKIEGKRYMVPNARAILGRAIGAVRRRERTPAGFMTLKKFCLGIAGAARGNHYRRAVGRGFDCAVVGLAWWNEVRRIADGEPKKEAA